MQFTWSERKCAINLKQHGLHFVDAPRVFEGTTYTFEDDRFSYSEQRFVTLGLLAGIPVSIVHTENEHEIRIISFRKATNREAEIYSMKSKTDWARLKSKDASAPTAEHPEADVQHIVRGLVRRGLKPLPPKASISLRVDHDVLEWFKTQGPGYQTKINAVLRAFRDASI
jgi:uncharacterized DUF497 family protein